IEEAATGNGAGWPRVHATPEAFFERCQTLNWRFFAHLYEAFVAQVLPQAMPGYAAPLHTLREHFPEVWIVDGSRLDAVAHRLKLLREVRARVLPGCVTASMTCTAASRAIWTSTLMPLRANCHGRWRP